MAKDNSTPGYCFAESKFLAKTRFHPTARHLSGQVLPKSVPHTPYIYPTHCIDSVFAELMETLRVNMNDVLRLPFSAQKRSRLVRNYWEVELLVKEIRLLLNPAVLQQLQQTQREANPSP